MVLQLAGGLRLPISYQGAGYDTHDGIRSVPTVSDVPWIDAVAVQQAGGNVTVAIVNRHPTENCTLTLALAGGQSVRTNSFEIMTDHARAMDTPLAQEQVAFVP